MNSFRLAPIGLAALALVVTAGALFAHDFWIVPNALQVNPGGIMELRGQTGVKFPTSQIAVTSDRVSEARVVGANSDERLTDLTTSGKSLLIRHRPTVPGQRIVAVALATRSTRTTPEHLKRYIALEGAPELAERYGQEATFPKSDSVTQVSAKYAKTLVEIGRGGPRAFDKTIGHALELVPVNDPSRLHAGDTLVVRLLYRGQPVPRAYLRAGGAAHGVTAMSDSVASAAPAPEGVLAETGADGTARIVLREHGLWNVRTLHAAPVAEAGARTWEVYFATLVFSVDGKVGPR